GLTFGRQSELHGRVLNQTPWGFCYFLEHDSQRAKWILVYDKEHLIHRSSLTINDITSRLKPGDLVRRFSYEEPQTIYPVKKIIIPAGLKGQQDKPNSAMKLQLLLDAEEFPEPVKITSFAYGIPGPKSEPSLYKGFRGADCRIDPDGQVILYHANFKRGRLWDRSRRAGHTISCQFHCAAKNKGVRGRA
ncbi:hypothetical protein KY326_03640, partial [Candidatus Woesearchaeota archaeon]|nr:hypothetical protein [Candidatus Woesearchaeota archaeon]